MKGMEINKGKDDVKQILASLIDASGAMTALLVTKQGSIVSDAGDKSYLNITAMAALIAGMFSATREVARLVGETEFSILLQQGKKRHIHISLITDEIMMVIVFEDYNRIGQVRHEARKASERLGASLAPGRAELMSAKDISMPEFKEYALNLIDRIFQG